MIRVIMGHAIDERYRLQSDMPLTKDTGYDGTCHSQKIRIIMGHDTDERYGLQWDMPLTKDTDYNETCH